MKKEELTKLIEDAMKGDLAAFEQVMAHKANQIVYTAVALMKDPQDGEDAAQEAMLKMYQHLDELKDPAAFQKWMYQIVSRTCIDLKRKFIRTGHDYLELEDELEEMRREFLPQDYIEDVDKREFLLEVINDLPENYRLGLLLFYYQDMSYQQIAELMDIPEKTVDNILQRGKKRIKEKLERRYGESMKLLAMNSLAVPVMAQAFHLDAVSRTAPDAVSRVLAEVSGQLAELAVGVAGAAGASALTSAASSSSSAAATSSTAGATATGSPVIASATSAATATSSATTTGATVFGLSVKTTVGIVAALSLTAGGALMAFSGERENLLPPEDLSQQEEKVILTLEDMIGEEAADQLRTYTAGAEDWQQWAAFLTELALEPVSGVMMSGAEYTLYHRQEQDKQLMVLEERRGDSYQAVFRFTDHQEEPPKESELLRSLEGWRP